MGCLRGFVWLFVIVLGLAFVGYLMRGNAPPPTRQAVADVATPSQRVILLPTWRQATDKSKIDDSKSVYLQLESNNSVSGRFGSAGPATLTLRCLENKTAVVFQFAGAFMADIQGYGDITYRIDDKKAQTRSFVESTNNESLGLWSGGSSIPFIKALFGAKTLYVRAVPYNENPVEAEFNVAGLDDHIGELRQACRW